MIASSNCLEARAGIEPTSKDLQSSASPLCHRATGAGNGTRTRDPNLGKVVLYQLSYSRLVIRYYTSGSP